MSDALGTPGGVVSDEDHRLAMAGLIAPQSSTLAVRTGVMWGPGTSALLTGTSATGTMTVNVAAHHAVTSRGAGDGIYLGPVKESTGTVNIAAAPGSNSRIDVVYSRQKDSGSTISPDGATAEEYGVVTGTAAVSPTKPPLTSVPGAVEIGTVTVAAGATSTNGAGVTIANTAALTVARGARIPVRNATERNALTTYAGLEVYRLDTGAVEQRNAANSAWLTVYDPAASTTWVVTSTSATSYSASVVATAWAPILGPFTTAVVPVGQTLEVEFSVPLIDLPTGTGLMCRIVTASVSDMGVAYWSNSNAASIGVGGFVKTTYPGAGAAVSYSVQVQKIGAGTPSLSGQAIGKAVTRHRIV